jgi:MFS transporter, DHA1 family, tetracycline resistance protein
MTRPPGKHALMFIFFTVLIDTIGFGVVMPVMPRLLMDMTGSGAADVTLIAGFLLTTYAAFQFICGPIMGNLGDRYGRRPVLLGSLAAFSFDYLLMGFAPNVGWLFIGRAVAGVAGAVYSPAMAYIADVSPPEKRAQSFGIVGAAFGVGFILGPALGGLIGEYGARAPFFVASALALVNFAYGLFVLPESLSADHRRKFEWRRANPLGTLAALRRYPAVISLAGAVFLWQLGHQVYPSTWSFFAKIRFNWSEAQIGASLAFVGVLMALTQGFLTGRIVKRIGELRAIVLGVCSGVLGMLGLAFATQGWLAFVAMTLGGLQGIAYPSMNAIMSKRVPANEQGELQGGLASMMSLTTILGPILMTQALGRFSAAGAPVYFPGAAFLLAAILATLSLVIVLRSAPSSPGALPEAGRAG